MGKLGQPIRVEITGGSVSQPIDVMVAPGGWERSLARLDKAIDFIQARAANACVDRISILCRDTGSVCAERRLVTDLTFSDASLSSLLRCLRKCFPCPIN